MCSLKEIVKFGLYANNKDNDLHGKIISTILTILFFFVCFNRFMINILLPFSLLKIVFLQKGPHTKGYNLPQKDERVNWY